MAETIEFEKKLTDLLAARKEWLEKEEIPKLKEDFRAFHHGFATIYGLLIKRKLVNEDPYKQESKITELKIPDVSVFPDNERVEKLTIRLSDFDNQLDFLLNFYSFSLEYLPLEKIKLILGLVKYIDWIRFTPDNSSSNTKNMADMVGQLKIGADQITMSIINESLSALRKSTETIMNYLKAITAFNREAYKLELREKAMPQAPGTEVQISAVKKKFAAAMPGKPFYPDLAEEVIRENNPDGGDALQKQVLKSLETPKEQPMHTKPAASFKSIIIDGLLAIGGTASSLAEIAPKLDENATILANKRTGFWGKVKRLIQQMTNQEAESPEYDIEYFDTTKQVSVKEKLVFASLRADLDRKTKTLGNYNSRTVPKMEALQEAQLMDFLEKSLREVQRLHRTLTALDEYFKAAVDKEDRDKIRGIKPELAAIKNAVVKANQKRYEYSAQKEEEEQFKKLGIASS